ncbi:carbohydrate ABC transporter substrate-binding protein [Treponema sp.]|uniref:carbohydrate ABC transporter substrate-binding protein n=1 Tax=Treponema sp. TaxID=166 RepID=UPI0025DC858D|nr:carbohydrate ABC transporter substrate-binding protein [Treponema sp.]MCR5218292.1 carbohydrate ABC transporter substrate-binding protein [Treponema sp.]
MKKIISVCVSAAVALTSLVSLSSCSKEKRGPVGVSNGGKVLNIYAWNNEFKERFVTYAEKKLPADVKVNWVINPNKDNVYQKKLDDALLRQGKAEKDKRVDLFLVEADYALKYVNQFATVDVRSAVGLTDAQLANQYKYTQDVMTDNNGVLKGVSWQATPAGLIYRRSIAKAVLGTDDPEKVGPMLSSWEKFDAVAAKAKAKGYYMLSGYDDSFRAFSDNMKSSWVTKDRKINIDPQIKAWIDQTKRYTDLGYNNRASLWSPESNKGMSADGKVFCYFGPAWFIDFTMAGNSLADADGAKKLGNGSYGDWAFCKGPQSFSWGGTWLCAADGTDNIDEIRMIMDTLCCDADTMKDLAMKYGDFTNNVPAMEAVAKSDYKNEFLGGQNHIKFFVEAAKSIDRSNISMYDQTMSEKIQTFMADYFNGNVTLDKAWKNFYKGVIEVHSELSE